MMGGGGFRGVFFIYGVQNTMIGNVDDGVHKRKNKESAWFVTVPTLMN